MKNILHARVGDPEATEIRILAKRSGLSENRVARMTIRAGLKSTKRRLAIFGKHKIT